MLFLPAKGWPLKFDQRPQNQSIQPQQQIKARFWMFCASIVLICNLFWSSEHELYSVEFRACEEYLRMAVLPQVVCFIVVVLFNYSQAQNEFMNLSEFYKKGVTLAEKQVNSHNAVQHHFLFFKSQKQSTIEVSMLFFLFLNVSLQLPVMFYIRSA